MWQQLLLVQLLLLVVRGVGVQVLAHVDRPHPFPLPGPGGLGVRPGGVRGVRVRLVEGVPPPLRLGCVRLVERVGGLGVREGAGGPMPGARLGGGLWGGELQ